MILRWWLIAYVATYGTAKVSNLYERLPTTYRNNCRPRSLNEIGQNCKLQDEGKTLNCTGNADDRMPLNNHEFVELEAIYLESVCLRSFSGVTFREIIHLRHLDFSHNILETLHYRTVASSAELSHLDLSHNILANLDYRTFSGLSNLSYLDLSNNLLQQLDYRLFNETGKLYYLDISNNILDSLDYRLLNATFELKCLNISNNFITSMDYNTFDFTKKLTHLILKNNSLETLDYRIFAATTDLSNLDVSFNSVEMLDRRLFSNLTNLVYLNLANNNLFLLLGTRVFESQENLVTLLLADNSITTIDVNFLRPLKHIQELNLAGNKFICNCELYSTMLWYTDRKLETNATCSYPVESRGLPWDDVISSETCHSGITGHIISLIAGASAASFILCLVVVSIVIVLWKRYVKRKAAQSSQPGEENFTYDDVLEPDHYEDVEAKITKFNLRGITNVKATAEPDQHVYSYI